MSTPILKSYVDERGNISVRVSRDVQVLTREEANRIEAEYKRMQADNAKLRELVRETLMDYRQYAEKYGLPPYLSDVNEHLDARLRELGIEVDG